MYWPIHEYLIWMSDLHGVWRKLYIRIEIVFWLIKYLLKLVTFLVNIAQKWWKWTKRLCQYFPEDHKYGWNCFSRLFYTPWANLKQDIAEPPLVLVNSCLFWRFWGDFDISNTKYQNLVNTSPVDQKFGKFLSCPKVAPPQILCLYHH